jgi:hypothetical protein
LLWRYDYRLKNIRKKRKHELIAFVYPGTVLAGGADRQLVRADGVKELSALYEMQAHDGAIITIHNWVTIDESTGIYWHATRASTRSKSGIDTGLCG